MSGEAGRNALDHKALERILEVTRQLARTIDLNTMLGHVIDAGRKVLGADRGTVFLYDPETDELFSKFATGTGVLRIPADKGIVGEAARSRQVINVPDAYADARFNRAIDRDTGYRTRCLLSVPLVGHDDSLVGVLQVLNKEGGAFSEEDERIATALGAQCAVALQRARMLEEIVTKEKMEREMAVARDIQLRVLPKTIPAIEGYDAAGWSRPADETGGDVYDVIQVAEARSLLLLGDATGHGIGAALSVTQVRSMLRMCVRLGAGLDKSFRNINDQLSDDLASNRFVTAFLGVLEADNHKIEYHSGGQGPILHLHAATGECERIKPSTVPMGLLAGMNSARPPALELAPGDILALITDGIYEYENPAGDQFDMPRVEALIRENQNEPMSTLVERIVQSVERFAEGAPQNDDMTILVVRRLP